MSAPIGPGDWVECVDAAPRAPNPHNASLARLRVGGIYQVEAVATGPHQEGIRLREVKSDHPAGGFLADRFRPIYRPKADLIESLKAPPQRVGEPA